MMEMLTQVVKSVVTDEMEVSEVMKTLFDFGFEVSSMKTSNKPLEKHLVTIQMENDDYIVQFDYNMDMNYITYDIYVYENESEYTDLTPQIMRQLGYED